MKPTPKDFVKALRACLAVRADAARAGEMSAYMKGLFRFFGVGSVERRQMLRAFLVERGGVPTGDELRQTANLLWREPERELHYCALDLLEMRASELELVDFPFLESLIVSHSWWDTVDVISPKLAGGILSRHRELLERKTVEWLDSGDLWLQRSALLCQLKWKANTNTGILSMAIGRTRESPEFFLRKAIGWALREYGKTDPDWVREFVGRTLLSGLSRREALKRLV
jgi:3-methyladenine DNA glycosylase AlkD